MDHKKISDLKRALKEHSEFYPAAPKSDDALDKLCFRYAQSLSNLPTESVLNTLKSMESTAGRYFPTLGEIRDKIGVKQIELVGCTVCDHTGLIHAVHNQTKLGYAFRCRCEKGQGLSFSCPTWSRDRFGDEYTPHRNLINAVSR